jgi:hypothetical protein
MLMMRERKRDRLPDHGTKYAVLITLFSAKRTGRFATIKELQEAITEEHNDRESFVSEQHVSKTVTYLREILEEFGYTIVNKQSFGYKIKNLQEFEIIQQ